jgi:hypothetical protein
VLHEGLAIIKLFQSHSRQKFLSFAASNAISRDVLICPANWRSSHQQLEITTHALPQSDNELILVAFFLRRFSVLPSFSNEWQNEKTLSPEHKRKTRMRRGSVLDSDRERSHVGPARLKVPRHGLLFRGTLPYAKDRLRGWPSGGRHSCARLCGQRPHEA